MKLNDLVNGIKKLDNQKEKVLQEAKVLVMTHVVDNHVYDYDNYYFDILEDEFELHIVFKDFEFYWYGDDILFGWLNDDGKTYSLNKFEKYVSSIRNLISKLINLDVNL